MDFTSIIWTLVLIVSVEFFPKLSAFDNIGSRQFSFPDQKPQPAPLPAPAPGPAPQNTQILARQLISGTVGPTIVNTPGGTGVTCICVPTGQCTSGGGSSDGSGQIDVRIVNTPGVTSVPPTLCGAGLVNCCLNGPYQCGVRYPPVAGSPTVTPPSANFGAFPWQAVLLTANDVYLGAGALISARHVLTAAHKVANLQVSSYKVRLGEWDAATTTEPIPAQEYAVSAATLHPNYNSANLQNSLAILTLATAVPLGRTPTIGTICLPTESFTGNRCFVAGWGKNDFGPSGQYQAIQKEVDVTVRSAADCQTTLSATRLGSNFVFNSNAFICAGGEAGKDACTGDGGAPLACRHNNGRWFVTGIVAWGIGCAQQGVPGVYANVASYVPWIQSIVNT